MRRDLISLFAVALIANTLAARFIARPGYMDAYYYFGGALQLARGQGFAEPYVWNYLSTLPNPPPSRHPERSEAQSKDPMGEGVYPSHLYWMPLPSLVAAPFVSIADRLAGTALPNGTLFRAAQIPFVLLGSALPLLGYAIAALTTGLRRHAISAALLTLFSGFYFVYWPNIDSFALYGLTAGGALLLYGLAHSHTPTLPRASSRLLFLSGLLSGLAHLTRADGVFVLGVLLLWQVKQYATRNTQYREAPLRDASRFTLHASLFILLGYLLVMLPWFVRNLLVVGAPLAPGGARALWLTEYDDLFLYPAERLTLARYLASGWASILAGKWWALKVNLGRLIAEQGTIFVFPFILIGLWNLRRRALIAPAILYGLVLFAAMTFAFTFPGARGGLFHSGAALLPFFFAAAPLGLDAAVETAARLLRHWQPEKSKPVFTALLVMGAAAVTALIFQQRVARASWPDPKFATDTAYAEIGEWLAGRGDARSIVAANNAPAFYYWTGHPGIVIPAGNADDLVSAMSAFGARWAVLDVNHAEGLNMLYDMPESDSRLRLHATFTDAAGKPVYLLERMTDD
jgi:hypothetical protein